MLTPRRLKGDEVVQIGDLVAKDDNDLSKGFRPLDGCLAGVPVSSFTYPLYRRRAILVLGHGGHGKGTFCRLLAELYGATCMSSSEAALPHIWPVLRQVIPGADTPAQAYALRRGYRSLWRELIALYNTPDLTTLSREILRQADVYDGMRSLAEFEASRHMFGLVVWVDASQRVGMIDPSLDIPQTVAHIIVENNRDLDGLRQNVVVLAESLGLRPRGWG